MVRRRGIGATLAASIIFSVLFASNLMLAYSAQDRSVLYSKADTEQSISGMATILIGTGGATILEGIQGLLNSRVFTCDNASNSISAAIASVSSVQSSGNLTVTASAGPDSFPQAVDNLSMLFPFNGSVPGELGFALSVHASGGVAAQGVSYSKSETHYLHIPIHQKQVESSCTDAFNTVQSVVRSETPSNCSGQVILELLQNLTRSLSSKYASLGFEFGLSYKVIPGPVCIVPFVVVLSESVVDPIGTVTLRMQERGQVSPGQP